MEDLLKILIVDDEPEARELLKYMLQEKEGLKVVGLAGHVDEALQIIKKGASPSGIPGHPDAGKRWISFH